MSTIEVGLFFFLLFFINNCVYSAFVYFILLFITCYFMNLKLYNLYYLFVNNFVGLFIRYVLLSVHLLLKCKQEKLNNKHVKVFTTSHDNVY